jgi:hypothetical protein
LTAEDPIDKRRRNFILGVVGRRWWSDNKSIDAGLHAFSCYFSLSSSVDSPIVDGCESYVTDAPTVDVMAI